MEYKTQIEEFDSGLLSTNIGAVVQPPGVCMEWLQTKVLYGDNISNKMKLI